MSADAGELGQTPGDGPMQETLLDAVSHLQTELRELILHQQGELRHRLGKWAEQQDQFSEIWYGRYLHLEGQLEHLLELWEEHAANHTSSLQSFTQGRGPLGPISMWESEGPKPSSKPETSCEEEPPAPVPPLEVAAGQEYVSLEADAVDQPSSICHKNVSFSQRMPSYIMPLNMNRDTTRETSGTKDTSGTAIFSKDAHMHWRRMIRKENARKQFMSEPLSDRSRRDHQQSLTCWQRILRSRVYEMGSLCLVILNAAFIGWQVEYFANEGVMPSLQRAGEIGFCILFSIELLLRLLAERSKLFQAQEWGWNVFDVVVVVMMLAEQILDGMSSDLSPSVLSQMSMLRVLRLVRVVRVLKVIRVLKFFRELRMMVHSILGSFKSMVWAVMVQGVMFYIFGISLTQGVVDYCSNQKAWTSSDTKSMRLYFGTLGRSCLSLFEAMAGGISWGELVDALQPLHRGYKLIFLLYISFAIFAVANIVTAVFVEGAMLNAQHDREVIIQEQMRSNQAYLQSMQQIFYEVDRDADGCIELEELRQAMKDERVVAYLSAFGLDITEVHTLFLLLDRDQRGVIDIDDFLLGCMRLKGS